MQKFLLIILFFTTLLFSSDMKNPEKIFQKKCQMCHALNKPTNETELRLKAAPDIFTTMKNLTKGIDALEEPKTKEDLRKLVIEFIKDYSFNPEKEKGYCEEMVYKSFNVMPSLKGFIKEEELNIVAPWIYDNFAPKD